MKDSIKVGVPLPDFELPDHTGTKRKLSFLQGDNPMVVSLVRGKFCPKDSIFLQDLVAFSAKCTVGYASLVTITTENFIGINELRQSLRANWPFLYDEDRIIQDELEIQEYTDPHNDPMIPYTFVLKPNLIIHKIYNGYWYFGRPSMHELHMDLRDITREIRLDWKIDTPEMKDKFENNQEDHFWPYGKDIEEEVARMTWEFND